MLTIVRLYLVASVAVIGMAGCDNSTTPAASANAGPVKGHANNTGAAPHETPKSPLTTVTFTVKDMGKRLNLM